MGIELIEQSDMTALTKSRLGNKSFVNDDDNWSYLSLRGRKYHDRKRAVAQGRDVPTTYVIDPTKQQDCDYLNNRLQEVKNKIEAELNSNPSKARMQYVISPLRNVEANYKTELFKQKCEERKSAEELKQSQSDILGAINQASSDNPNVDTTTGGGKSKYLIYGTIGVVGIVLLMVVVKAIRK